MEEVNDRVAEARAAVRIVERFAYRALSDVVEPDRIEEARLILRITVGLRRKLDTFGRSHGE